MLLSKDQHLQFPLHPKPALPLTQTLRRRLLCITQSYIGINESCDGDWKQTNIRVLGRLRLLSIFLHSVEKFARKTLLQWNALLQLFEPVLQTAGTSILLWQGYQLVSSIQSRKLQSSTMEWSYHAEAHDINNDPSRYWFCLLQYRIESSNVAFPCWMQEASHRQLKTCFSIAQSTVLDQLWFILPSAFSEAERLWNSPSLQSFWEAVSVLCTPPLMESL